MARPLSLSALTVLELSPPEMVTIAAEAGFSHVGLRLIPATPEETRYPSVGDTPLIRQVLARLADTGVKVLDTEIFRLRPDTVVADYLPAMETAARLGARHLLLAGNDPDRVRLTDRLGQFCDQAGRFDLGVDLEPMPWTEVKNLAEGAALLQAIGRDNAGLLIDAIHFDRGGSRVEEIAGLPPRWLRYIQLCDAPAERPTTIEGLLHQARAERLLPGEGGLDLLGLLGALPRALPISLEIPMVEWSRTAGALERAKKARLATEALLTRLEQG